MAEFDYGGVSPRISKPVMVRFPQRMVDDLEALARARELPLATLVRQLTKERLDQLHQERADQGVIRPAG